MASEESVKIILIHISLSIVHVVKDVGQLFFSLSINANQWMIVRIVLENISKVSIHCKMIAQACALKPADCHY